ncbi:ABC transporter permease [Actinomadura spongiicola]|uniref:ABC transporter permease n=1 Tax=Actinomadura spongiicola TaxID=2303421 RepID=A0A372GC28_9ACTN|nr:ABC transporter permease [Actinomadura spongiicola]RFS82944.1 ABC transporter permease [Actinomadura spongiicola]
MSKEATATEPDAVPAEPAVEPAALRAGKDGGLGWGLKTVVALTSLVLIAPTAVVIPMSFSGGTTFAFPPKDWSLRWYESFFTSEAWMRALLTSVQLALLVAVTATVLGGAAAFGLNRAGFPGRGAIRSLVMAPLIVPSIVVAVSIYGVFLRWHLTGTPIGFVIGHTVMALPFVVTVMLTSLSGYDRTLDTAAATLGATPLTTFLRITVPLIAPGVMSGFAFAFVYSLDEVVIALFLQSPDITTLPVKMYNSITLEIDPTIAAASSLMVVATSFVLLIPQFVRRKRSTR